MHVFICLIAATSSTVPAARQSEFIDLGSLGGSVTYAFGINDRSEVVGRSMTAAGEWQAFVWLPEPAYGLAAGMNAVDAPDSPFVDLQAINSFGEAAGYLRPNHTAATSGLLLSQDSVEVVPPLAGYSCILRDINDDGVSVGSTSTSRGLRALLYSAGIYTLLPNAGPYHDSVGTSINRPGDMAGYYYIPFQHTEGFVRWADGRIERMGFLPGFEFSSVVNDINDHGLAAGSSAALAGGQQPMTDMPSRACLWLPEEAHGLPQGMHDLGTLPNSDQSYGLAINNDGTVVCNVRFPSGELGCFTWWRGVATDLRPRLPVDWRDVQCLDINDGGDIIGYAAVAEETRAFILMAATPRLRAESK